MEKSDEPSMASTEDGYTPTGIHLSCKVIGIGDVDAFGHIQQALGSIAADDDVITIIAYRLYTGKAITSLPGSLAVAACVYWGSGLILRVDTEGVTA